MKKLFFVILTIFTFPILAQANEISSITSCNKTSIKVGETVECSIKIAAAEELDYYSSEISYDKQYLSIESIKGQNNWSSRSNTKLDLYTNNKETLLNTTIALVTFKAKSSPSNGTTEISVGDNTYNNIEKSTIKILSNDNFLSKLYIKGYSLAFKKTTNTYNITLNKEKIKVEAVLNDTKAKFAPNAGPREIALKEGKNTINISVISESGLVNTYTINVTKKATKDSNTNLKSLSVEGYKLDKDFNKDTIDYEIKVPYNTTKIKVSAELESNKSKFDSNNKPGEYELINDKTKINIKVLAENNETKTYTITVNKEKNNSLLLKKLTLSEGVIEFKPSKLVYNINVDSHVEDIEVSAEAQSKDAKVEIDKPDKLNIGLNIIKIKVTNDENKEKIYTINVNKLEETKELSSNTNLKSLTIKGYKLPFNIDVHEYNLKIKNVNKLNITAVSEDENSVVTIVGNKNLKDGSKIKIFVTSEDTSQTTYTINIEKDKTLIYIILILSIILLVVAVILLIISKKKKKDEFKIDITLDADDKKRLVLK